MGSFETPPPSLKPSTLKEIAKQLFSVSGQIKELVSERDQNARLRTADQEYVLKIANLAEDKAFLEFQNAALQHLAAVDPELSVPRLVANVQGTDISPWSEGEDTYQVRLMTFLQGRLFGDVAKTDALFHNLGQFMGGVSRSLQGFGHAEAHRPDFLWNLDNVLACKAYVSDIENRDNRALVNAFYENYQAHVAPRLAGLRSAVIHNDANDNNLVVDEADDSRIAGLIDFGDMVFAKQVNELAVMLAYALMEVTDIVASAQALIAGYTTEFPLTEDEVELLFDLAAMRLVMSVCISSNRAKDFPDNEYLLISQAPGFDLLKRLKSYNRSFLISVARKAAGFSAVKGADDLKALIGSEGDKVDAITSIDLASEPRLLVSPEATADMVQDSGSTYGISGYGPLAQSDGGGIPLGIGLYLKSETTLQAPLAGQVVSLIRDDGKQWLVLQHQSEEKSLAFFTSYRFCGISSVELGQDVGSGDVLGTFTPAAQGVERLYFQLLSHFSRDDQPVPEACEPAMWPLWQDICLDPNLILGLSPETFLFDDYTPEKMMKDRGQLLAPSLSVAYARKLKMVRGKGAYLYDHTGRAFLDCVNNITHVGHCHPHVVKAISEQAALLNTNSRYLSENIQKLASRILKTMPEPLSVMIFVNSGSEANELALRMVQAATGRKTMIVLDHAYHGNTGGLVDLSPYKFNGKGGAGCPDHVRIADFPDPYRGVYRGYGEESGKAYVSQSDNYVDYFIQYLVKTTGEGPGGFIAESLAGVGGQVIYPDGYFKHAYEAVHRSGGLCIADEVQVGFGRVGSHMWAFELQDVVPDIVTLGKPIGNGHPMAAVVTTREIAEKFANGMEYFNSFGGNPVSCAVGLAVLDVIEQEGLQQNAKETGDYLQRGLKELAKKYALIGDVRGTGLFIGAELVKDPETLEPATVEAHQIVQYMRDNGVLLSTDGPLENVLKLKPPMVFKKAEADIFLNKLDKAFQSLEN